MDDAFNKQLIAHHEGTRTRVYKDTRGIDTVGIGFNLQDPQAYGICKAVGVDWRPVMNGYPLTLDEIKAIFDIQYATVAEEARSIFPDIDEYPREASAVICDMLFQLGITRFKFFVHAIAAFKCHDWACAAREMLHSTLATQAPNRVHENILLLEQIVCPSAANHSQPA